jgi:hypothetical protein
MITRQRGFPRLYTPGSTFGASAQALGPYGRWARGSIYTAGSLGLTLPSVGGLGGPAEGFGYAMDPSDPKTWRRPVRWT